MFKVGDLVRCTGCEYSWLKTGEEYRVKHVGDNYIVVYGSDSGWMADHFELVTEPAILVPVDPACVPDGWEAVRVGHPRKGEHWVSSIGNVGCDEKHDSLFAVCVIVRKKYVAYVSIPKGWWVYQRANGDWMMSENEPQTMQNGEFATSGRFTCLRHLNFTPPENGQPRQVS